MTKIIALELRLESYDGARQEIQMIPLDILLPAYSLVPGGEVTMTMTFHTTTGDVNPQPVRFNCDHFGAGLGPNWEHPIVMEANRRR